MATNNCNMPPQLFVATGGVSNYSFDFEYINRVDVEVYVGGSNSWTQYTLGDASNIGEYEYVTNQTIRLNADGAANVLVTRVTDMCDAEVTFYSGTSIKADDLNSNQTQNLYLFQELNGRLFGSNGDGVGSEFWNTISSTVSSPVQGQTIKDGEPWQDSDDFVVTAAAIDNRIDTKITEGTVGEGGKGIKIDGKKIIVDVTPGKGLIFSDDTDDATLEVDSSVLNPPVPDLQAVTDVGNTTTNGATFGDTQQIKIVPTIGQVKVSSESATASIATFFAEVGDTSVTRFPFYVTSNGDLTYRHLITSTQNEIHFGDDLTKKSNIILKSDGNANFASNVVSGPPTLTATTEYGLISPGYIEQR